MLPNLRPDCGARIFDPRSPPAQKLHKFQSLKNICALQYFLLHCTKSVLYKILEAAALDMFSVEPREREAD
jgi:hypothetical protein